MPTIFKPKKKKSTPSLQRKQRQKFYNRKEWSKLRDWKMVDTCGLCEDCLNPDIINEDGTFEKKITPADAVHHIKPFGIHGLSDMEREERFNDPSNLLAVCVFHHLLRHHEIKDKDILQKIKEHEQKRNNDKNGKD